MPLGTLAQLDFAAGMFRSVARHLVPENGAWDLVNVLLDEDGSAYRRGGSEYLSTSAFGTGLSFLWDGYLGPGQRTVIANSADFGVLDGAEAPVNLGGSGLAVPKRAVELAGMLHIGGGTVYGGSRKTAPYSTGTISATNGSKTITGSGTTFNTLVDAGMILQIGAERPYVVASITDATHLELRDAYEGSTGAGKAYSLNVLGAAARTSDLYAVAGDRLFSLEGTRAYFSAPFKPWSFSATDYHELPGGVDIIGAERVRDTLLLFSTDGLWLVSGIPLDLTDALGNPQQRVEQVSKDLILLSHEGLAAWSGSVIAPCADGVWLLDGTSTPVRLSNSIAKLWQTYVAAGYKTGISTVFRSHLFMPIVNSSGVVQDLLVCRLDRPVQTRLGVTYPWTRFAGFSGLLTAFAVRSGGSSSARDPKLLAASTASSARVVKGNAFFSPTVATKNDPDGTFHQDVIDTRDYPTGDGRSVNTVRRLKVRYELIDAASDDPRLAAYYSVGIRDETGLAKWDEATWDTDLWAAGEEGEWFALAGTAPEDEGRNPYTWEDVNKRARFIRFRLATTGPSSSYALRTVELIVRPNNKL